MTALALLCAATAGPDPSPALQAFGDREDELLSAGDVEAATELNVDTWPGPSAGDVHEVAVTLAARIPDARHIELDWAGHLPNLERPTVVNDLLFDFLVAAWPGS